MYMSSLSFGGFMNLKMKNCTLAMILGAAVTTTVIGLSANPASAYTIKLTGPNQILKGGSGNFTATFSEATARAGIWEVFKAGGIFGSNTSLATGTRVGTDTIINFSLSCDLNCILSGKNGSGEPGGSTNATDSISIFFRNPDLISSTDSNIIKVQCVTKIIVPEPSSTFSVLALGTLGAASTFKRKLKTSQSTENETIKVG